MLIQYPPSKEFSFTVAMVPDKIILPIVCTIGSVGNLLALTFFILHQKKGLTNKLFLLLCVWDFSACLITSVREWTLKTELRPIYIVALWNSCFTTELISVTRAIRISAPFYHIKRKIVWVSMVMFFLYTTVVGLTLLYTGGELDSKELNAWQIAYLLNDAFWFAEFFVAVIISNVTCVVQLCRQGSVNISPNNADAAKTVLILSAIFLLSNSLTMLHVARNIKFAINGTQEQLINGWNTEKGKIFFKMLFAASSICNPIVYFVRKQSFRNWLRRKLSNVSRHSETSLRDT